MCLHAGDSALGTAAPDIFGLLHTAEAGFMPALIFSQSRKWGRIAINLLSPGLSVLFFVFQEKQICAGAGLTGVHALSVHS